jgi:hypothetical protein
MGGTMFKKLMVLMILIFISVPAFAQSVDTAWVRRYNGPGNEKDEPCGIAVDSSGNIYVSGKSNYENFDYLTIKYYPNGDTAWIRRYGGSSEETATAMALDSYGNVYVTGYGYNAGTGFDYTTIKYDQDGNLDWSRTYNGTANANDFANAIAVDNSGNVYVTGETQNSGTGNDYTTIKYYPNSDTAWVRKYIGIYDDKAYAIACDGSGNVFVTGGSADILTNYDIATIKYKANGDTSWVRRYNGPTDSLDVALRIAFDGSGNVYVAGASTGIGTALDYITVKYDSSGNKLWEKRYNGPGNGSDIVMSIATDSSDNSYVTGQSNGDVTTGNDIATIKYYPNGDTAWVRTYNRPPACGDNAFDLAIDHKGNSYVTGFTICTTDPPRWDYVTIKYDSIGNQLWQQIYDGPASDSDKAYYIAVDDSDYVYVTGTSWGSGTYSDYATIKYVQFLRGDANSDKKVTVSDIVFLVSYLFKHGSPPNPIQSGDANCDGKVNVADIVYLVAYLFKHGPMPCQ